MKKVFLIGKFNTVFQEINNYLGKYFNVQVCVDNLEVMKGMLKVNVPELAIISLIGLDETNVKLLDEFKYNYPRVPVICVGTESEQAKFNEFFRNKQFTAITRPVNNDTIIKNICEILGVGFDSEKGIIADTKDSRKTILLVDDNAIQLRTLNGMLNGQYEVRMATSGMNALTQIGKKVPDLILLDYEMPLCDGKMTLQMIREIEEAKDVPVVFLTGVNDKEHIKSVLALKPAGYLLKPADKNMIFDTIERVLGE
ncbi:MAG: response regulator [Lachnospiraceae bacterium]|nr:response regulator [Lachnospiraceae bacterium]